MSSQTINHDQTRMNYKAIGLSVALLVGLVVVAFVFSLYLYLNTRSQELTHKEATAVDADLQKLRIREDEQLNGYHWTDGTKSHVALPIEDAKKQVLSSY